MVFLARPAAAMERALDPLMMAVPVAIHTHTNVLGFTNGYYQELPALAVVALSMLALSVAFLLWPWWHRRAVAKDVV